MSLNPDIEPGTPEDQEPVEVNIVPVGISPFDHAMLVHYDLVPDAPYQDWLTHAAQLHTSQQAYALPVRWSLFTLVAFAQTLDPGIEAMQAYIEGYFEGADLNENFDQVLFSFSEGCLIDEEDKPLPLAYLSAALELKKEFPQAVALAEDVLDAATVDTEGSYATVAVRYIPPVKIPSAPSRRWVFSDLSLDEEGLYIPSFETCTLLEALYVACLGSGEFAVNQTPETLKARLCLYSIDEMTADPLDLDDVTSKAPWILAYLDIDPSLVTLNNQPSQTWTV